MKELREEIGIKHLKMKVAGSRMRWAEHVQRMSEDRLSKRTRKAEEGGRRGWQKRVAEGEEEDQNCNGKTVSNDILKGQVRTAKS